MKAMPWMLLGLLLGSGCSQPAPPSAMVPPSGESDSKPLEIKRGGWESLFDGSTLDGWKANEDDDSFKVEDGAIVAQAAKDHCHLFYVGPVADANFKNFEFKADVLTKPGANSGIYFHTKFQENGWPDQGYEVQINNSHTDIKRTGGLYAIYDNFLPVAKDNQWFNVHIVVQGRSIKIFVNGKETTDYREPESVQRTEELSGKRLSSGTFALQAHDPNSLVKFRNIQVKLLPDEAR